LKESVERIQLVFLALMARIVALMLKIVGLVLVTSLFIIPTATARKFTRTPETMAVAAGLRGTLAVAGGLWSSLQWDTPAGASIVLCATLLFLLSALLPQR